MSRCLQVAALAGAVALSGGCTDNGAAAAEAADHFVADLQAGAWNAAYSRLSAPLQEECGSVQRLAEMLQVSGQQPTAYVLTEPRLRRGHALISARVENAEGRSTSWGLSLEKTGDDWAVVTWSTGNREVCQEALD